VFPSLTIVGIATIREQTYCCDERRRPKSGARGVHHQEVQNRAENRERGVRRGVEGRGQEVQEDGGAEENLRRVRQPDGRAAHLPGGDVTEGVRRTPQRRPTPRRPPRRQLQGHLPGIRVLGHRPAPRDFEQGHFEGRPPQVRRVPTAQGRRTPALEKRRPPRPQTHQRADRRRLHLQTGRLRPGPLPRPAQTDARRHRTPHRLRRHQVVQSP